MRYMLVLTFSGPPITNKSGSGFTDCPVQLHKNENVNKQSNQDQLLKTINAEKNLQWHSKQQRI